MLFRSIGYMFIFKKCGVQRRWAFVPIAREYQLGLCADKEKDGRTFTVLAAFYYATFVLAKLLQNFKTVNLFLQIPIIGFYVAMSIYILRVYLGLIKVFERRKGWLFVFFFFEVIAVLCFGCLPSFVPSKKVENLKKVQGAKVLDQEFAAAEDSLTVNIKDRTVIDFFRKRYFSGIFTW